MRTFIGSRNMIALKGEFYRRYKVFIFLLFYLLSHSNLASDEPLFRINKLVHGQTYLWGMMDISGKIIFSPKFEGLGEFQGDVAWAKLNGKWGLIDKTGNFIRKPEFQDVHNFENNLAWVIQDCTIWLAGECDKGKWGLVNLKGEILISPGYDGVLSEESVYVPRLFGKLSGELFSDHTFFKQDGFARVYLESKDRFNPNRKFGIVNEQGKEIIPPLYYKFGLFKNEVAPFALSNGKGIFFGLIRSSSEVIVEPIYKLIEPLVPVEATNEAAIWAASYFDPDKRATVKKLLSEEGTEISPIRLHQIYPYKDGLALARESNTAKWGFLDKTGMWAIEPKYKHGKDALADRGGSPNSNVPVYPEEPVKEAKESKLWFCKNEMDPFDKEERCFWNFSDLDGKNIRYIRSFEKGEFNEGMAWVSLRNRKKNNGHIIYQALINEQGQELTEPLFYITLPFRNGLGAAMVVGGKWGYINKKGKIVWWMK